MSNQAIAEAAGNVTEQVVETTLDVVEAAPSAVVTVAKHNPAVLVGVAVASAAVGAGVAVYITHRVVKARYEQILEDEIEKAKDHYSKKFKDGAYSDPAVLAAQIEEDDTPDAAELSMVEAAADIAQRQGYGTSYDKIPPADLTARVTTETVEVKESIAQNVFDTNAATGDDSGNFGIDIEAELEKRRKGEPYIVSHQAYYENEPGYEQITIMWYEGDSSLADDAEQLIDKVDGVIGGTHNLRFGYGTDDNNVVHIFNDNMKTAFEVVRSHGKYAEEVLGFEDPASRRGSRPVGAEG